MIDRASIVASRPDVLSTVVDDEIVLFDAERGKYFGLDAIGAEIWRTLTAPTKLDDLIAGLSQTYDGDGQAIEKDVFDLIGRLADNGLVSVS